MEHKTFAVLGLSKFGYRTATALFDDGANVIAVDKDEHLVQKISSAVTKALCADIIDWEVLEHAGVFDVDVAVIGLRDTFDVAVLLTNHLKKNTKVAKIVAQVDTDEKAEALRLMGADIVVFPEKDMADRVVRQLTSPNLVEHISLSPNAAIIEVPPPEEYVGKSLVELQIRAKYNIYVIGIKHHAVDGESAGVVIAPPPDTKFQPGDTMLLLGNQEALSKFSSDLAKI